MRINWKENEVKEIVKSSISIAECLRKLKSNSLGSSYKTFKKYIITHNIDTSHFLGQRWQLTKPKQYNHPLSYYLVENSIPAPSGLKKRLLKEKFLDYKCQICGIDSWLNNKLVLQLDHINGINNDHRLCNLRLLCPNCHSQTITYCGKNAKQQKLEHYCANCQAPIVLGSRLCRPCADNNRTKIIWPEAKELIKMVEDNGFDKTGKILGVHGNTVRKRIKRHCS